MIHGLGENYNAAKFKKLYIQSHYTTQDKTHKQIKKLKREKNQRHKHKT